MKIFNFTNGVKGELLGNVKLPDSLGATLSDGDDYIHIEISGCSYHNSAHIEYGEPCKDWSEKPILPSDYNVDAICFCTGKFEVGDNKYEWHWNFLATAEWLTKNGYPTEDGKKLLKEVA